MGLTLQRLFAVLLKGFGAAGHADIFLLPIAITAPVFAPTAVSGRAVGKDQGKDKGKDQACDDNQNPAPVNVSA